MKVLVYENKDKDLNGEILYSLSKELNKNLIEYVVIEFEDEIPNEKFEAVFVIGGDGTILRRTEYANRNDVPIIGINCGKLGYLSEFEKSEIAEAVNLFINGKLIKDSRATLSVVYKDKEFFALNDVIIQRIYTDNKGSIINVSFSIDDNKIDTVIGDGIIVATPTGSTAYSLSAGGAILAPGINAFSITPISAHSLSQRPVIFSSDSNCVLRLEKSSRAGLFVDGKFISIINGNDSVFIKKADKPTVFLRREHSNFYKKLTKKLSSRNNENHD